MYEKECAKKRFMDSRNKAGSGFSSRYVRPSIKKYDPDSGSFTPAVLIFRSTKTDSTPLFLEKQLVSS